MSLKLTSEEVNFIVYQYLLEQGFNHSAFTFGFESDVVNSKFGKLKLPPCLLLTFLEKVLFYMELETHFNSVTNSVTECNEDFSLINPHICRIKTTFDEKESTSLLTTQVENGAMSMSMLMAQATTLTETEEKVSKVTSSITSSELLESFENTKITRAFVSPLANTLILIEDFSTMLLYKITKMGYLNSVSTLPHLSVKNANTSISSKNSSFESINVFFNENGTVFATLDQSVLRVWNINGGLVGMMEIEHLISSSSGVKVDFVKFHPEEETLLLYHEKKLVLWSYNSPNLQTKTLENVYECVDVFWKAHDIISFHRDSSIRFWNPEIKTFYKVINQNEHFGSFITLAKWLHSTNHCVLASWYPEVNATKIKVFEYLSALKLNEFDIFKEEVTQIAWLSKSVLVPAFALVTNSKSIKIVLLHSGKSPRIIEVDQYHKITSIIVSNTLRYFACVLGTNIIYIYTLPTNLNNFDQQNLTKTEIKGGEEILSMKFSENDNYLFLVQPDSVKRISLKS